MAYTDKEVFKILNKIGLTSNPQYICINANEGYKGSLRLVSIQCVITKTIINKVGFNGLRSGNNPFYLGKAKDLLVEKEINQLGLKSNPQYICVNSNNGYTKNSQRLVSVKNQITKEIKNNVRFHNLKNGNNPFYTKKIEGHIVEREINNLGKKSKPQFICFNPNFGTRKTGSRLVSVQCLITKKIKYGIVFNDLKNGSNPFYLGKAKDLLVEKEINQLGLKSNPQYRCSNPYYGKSRSGARLVSIQCLKTKKIKGGILISNLRKGHNHFNEFQNRVEVNKIQPQYERMLKKLKIDYVREFRLGKNRIDFMLKINNKKYGLEVKQSEKNHITKNQLETYRKLANLRQYELKKVFLSDPKGLHSNKGSISIKALENTLKSLLQK